MLMQVRYNAEDGIVLHLPLALHQDVREDMHISPASLPPLLVELLILSTPRPIVTTPTAL